MHEPFTEDQKMSMPVVIAESEATREQMEMELPVSYLERAKFYQPREIVANTYTECR